MEEYETSPRASKRRRTGTYATRRTTLDTQISSDSTSPRSQSNKRMGDAIGQEESGLSNPDQEGAVPLQQTDEKAESAEPTSRRSSTRKRKPTERASQAEDATPTHAQKPSRRNVIRGEDARFKKATKPAHIITLDQGQQGGEDSVEPQPRPGRKTSDNLASDTARTEKQSKNRSAPKDKVSRPAMDGFESAVQSPQPKGILTPSRHGRTKRTGPRKSVVFDADERQIEAQLGFKDIDSSTKSKDANKRRRASKDSPEGHQATPSRKRNVPIHSEPQPSDSDDDLDVPDMQTAPDVDEILSLNTADADIDDGRNERILSYEQDHEYVVAIKREILRRITNKSLPPICHLQTQYNALHSLLSATITAGESNSLLLLGSRGSGKSLLVSHALADLTRSYADDFHVVKLDGLFQTDDKLALREIWRQLGREMAVPEEEAGEVSSYADTMASLLSLLSHPEELADPGAVDAMDIDMDTDNLKTTKSIIFIMDEFDLFTTHPRQTLLYNLFDIAQAKKAPIAVIGCSTRMDVVDCLEKRVKSRFSHRWLHLPTAKSFSAFEETVSSILSMPVEGKEALGVADKDAIAWREKWNHVIKVREAIPPRKRLTPYNRPFLGGKDSEQTRSIHELRLTLSQLTQTHLLPSSTVQALLKKTYYSTKSLPEVLAALYIPIATLPVPVDDDDDTTATKAVISKIDSASFSTTPPSVLTLLPQLPTLHLSLLIAAARLETVHNLLAVNFALAYTHYAELLARAKLQRSSLSAMNQGGAALTGAGLRQWSKTTARGAWEDLARWEVLVPASGVGGGGGTSRAGDDGLVAGEGVGTKIFRVDVTLDEIAWAVKERAGGTGVGDVLVKWCSDV
ncbi:origin recognition complex subunit 4 [Knufia peltigerae]|uniref:Origin recognition complex subunit 4 n=1 Tax=Knufia peltigerae TaxID=1002370 RepID=A0AA38XVW9_9EURO|nr:origin recognition complex subunit 4 [Knufia peltigerae]